jgi:hypothetical protein
MSGMVVSITVNGEDEEIDLAEILGISSAESEREQVAAQMAWWGAIWGQAIETEQLADAAYRTWRAEQTARFADGGLAEWKCKSAVEAMPEFRTHKEQIAAAARNATAAKAIYEAFGKKSELLTKLVRRDDNDNYHGRNLGREQHTDDADEREHDPRVSKMKSAVGATKRKGA